MKQNEITKDPFDQFGHGIQAYFRILTFLIRLFFAFSILFLPVIIMYSHGKEYDSDSSF